MTTSSVESKDGTWRLEVTAFATHLFVYHSIGVTTRVFVRGSPNFFQRLFGIKPGWVAGNGQSVMAGGQMGPSSLPNVLASLPGSPVVVSNKHSATCNAWAFGFGIKLNLDPVFSPTGGQPTGGPGMIVDMVQNGFGSATLRGETLSAGSLSAI